YPNKTNIKLWSFTNIIGNFGNLKECSYRCCGVGTTIINNFSIFGENNIFIRNRLLITYVFINELLQLYSILEGYGCRYSSHRHEHLSSLRVMSLGKGYF